MPFEFKFPDVGEGITEGEIVKWKVKEGDIVKQDQDLADIETDKAVVQIPSPRTGKILKLHAGEGDIIKVGQVIVTLGEEGESAPESAKSQPKKKPEMPGEEAEKPKKESTGVVGEIDEASETLPSPSSITQPVQTKRVLATPAIRKMAEDLHINIENVDGTGPEGRVTESDIKAAAGGEKTTKKVAAAKVQKKYDMYGYISREPLKGVRRAISNRMTKSHSIIPAVTHMDDADVTVLWSHREKEKKNAEKKGTHLTFMPFIVKACIAALKDNPRFNSTLDDDTEEIILKKYFNIGFALDTDEGLMVPVIKVADKKNIVDISKEIENLAKKARDRTIDIGDLRGGSFTITNIGSLGGTYSTPMINHPESAILAVGKIREVPMAVNGKVEIRKIMPLSLAFDHRIADGADAARFMNSLISYLEDPDKLLLE